jgi:hypothetical protein
MIMLFVYVGVATDLLLGSSSLLVVDPRLEPRLVDVTGTHGAAYFVLTTGSVVS